MRLCIFAISLLTCFTLFAEAEKPPAPPPGWASETPDPPKKADAAPPVIKKQKPDPVPENTEAIDALREKIAVAQAALDANQRAIDRATNAAHYYSNASGTYAGNKDAAREADNAHFDRVDLQKTFDDLTAQLAALQKHKKR